MFIQLYPNILSHNILCLYPIISIVIQQYPQILSFYIPMFIHLYPIFSDHLWKLIQFHPALYPFVSIDIRRVIRLIIRSGFRLVRRVLRCCALIPSSKLVCINSPPPGAAIAGPPGQHRRWLLPASSSRGIGSRRVQRRRRISAGQQRCRLRPVRRPPRRSSRVPVLRRLRISATSAGTGRRKEWRRFHGGDSWNEKVSVMKWGLIMAKLLRAACPSLFTTLTVVSPVP